MTLMLTARTQTGCDVVRILGAETRARSQFQEISRLNYADALDALGGIPN